MITQASAIKLVEQAELAFRSGQFARAQTLCHQAVAAQPDHAGPYLFLGNLMVHDDRLIDAIAAYRQSLHCESNAPFCQFNLAHTLQLTSDLTGAEQGYQAAPSRF